VHHAFHLNDRKQLCDLLKDTSQKRCDLCFLCRNRFYMTVSSNQDTVLEKADNANRRLKRS